MNVKSNIWFENDNNGFFGKGHTELLEQIDTHGSISAAAKAFVCFDASNAILAI